MLDVGFRENDLWRTKGRLLRKAKFRDFPTFLKAFFTGLDGDPWRRFELPKSSKMEGIRFRV